MSSGKYPCHMCLAYKVMNKGKYTWVSGKLRTLGMQRKFARDFLAHLENIKAKHPDWSEEEAFKFAKRDAKNFYNVTQMPLLSGPNDRLMLLLLPPPEFHIFEGNVYKLADALNERWFVEEGVEDRFYACAQFVLFIKREEHRKAFNGPSCKKFRYLTKSSS